MKHIIEHPSVDLPDLLRAGVLLELLEARPTVQAHQVGKLAGAQVGADALAHGGLLGGGIVGYRGGFGLAMEQGLGFASLLGMSGDNDRFRLIAAL